MKNSNGRIIILFLGLFLLPARTEVNSHFIVVIPDFECSGLVDPAIIKTEPSWIWGGAAPISPAEIFARLRLPNLLLPREPDLASRVTPWSPLVQALTRKQATFLDFNPYQKGRDLFIFQYDWRRGIGNELSLQLQMAIDDFSEQHAIACGKREDRSPL